jgi:bifunctional non-homologous end joining protein LigD
MVPNLRLVLLPDAVVPTRAQLEGYWRTVANRALKYLARRSLKLVRHVAGTLSAADFPR